MRTQITISMHPSEKEQLNLYSTKIKKQETSKYIKGLVTKDSGIVFVDKRKKC